MTFIWYEVFPVTLASQHTVLIRPHQEQKFPAWMIPNLPNSHPNDIVVRHLISFFGDGFDACQMIVHSTSWRYEPECDRLLLTYLAVLPQGPWLKQWIATKRIAVEPIGAVATQHGDHLFPPQQIEWHAVLAHALDHLASLSAYDLAIQAALEPEWREILRWRSPKPAGCLQPGSSEMVPMF
ncbi:MAG TPA: hypothetical protein VF026_32460 [Ktedonobacteraceae bacterium]